MGADKIYYRSGFWYTVAIILAGLVLVTVLILGSITVNTESVEVVGVVTHADAYYAKYKGTVYALSVSSEDSSYVLQVNSTEYAKYAVGDSISFALLKTKSALGDYVYKVKLNGTIFRLDDYKE